MPSSHPSAALKRFAHALESVQATNSRLEKRRILVEYMRSLPDDSLPLGVTYLCGRPFPRADNRTLSIGGAAFSQALLHARAELTSDDLRAAWMRHSDPGDAAADLWQDSNPLGESLNLSDLSDRFDSLYRAKGPTGKVPLLADAFRRMDSSEIRAFVKVLLSEPRIGVQEYTVEDAVAHAFGASLEDIRAANRHRADLGAVTLEAKHGRLEIGGFNYFTPVDPMLSHAADEEEVIRRLGAPAWVEDKYDGIRCQLHKDGAEVRLYSRDRKDMTRQFPDVVSAFSAVEGRYALDGELLAMDAGRSLPFGRIQQRVGRVAPTDKIVAVHPVSIVAFDLLAIGDESLLDMPLRERREKLENLQLPPGQYLAPQSWANSVEELQARFTEAQARGNEGLMCKNPDSAYISGRRGYNWLKVKRPLDTLDVVIVGAEWGHGKRRNVLSDYTFAVLDDLHPPRPELGEGGRGGEGLKLVNIGKAYGGLTDAMINEMTERLQGITLEDYGRYRVVKPEIVLEVEFNGIQRSARHKSGYALRFPRIVRIRADKGPNHINTLSDVARMYASLSGEEAEA